MDSLDNFDDSSEKTSLTLDDFLDLNGDHSSSEDQSANRKASDWFLLGTRAYVHNQFDLAIVYFDKVLDLEPKNSRVYASRADVYTEQGLYQEAHNDYLMAAHFGDKQAQELLDEFILEMQDKKIMDQSGRFLIPNTNPTYGSYLPVVQESDLGEDMHIIDINEDPTEHEF